MKNLDTLIKVLNLAVAAVGLYSASKDTFGRGTDAGFINYGGSKADGSHDHRTNKGPDRTPAQKAADAAKSH